MFFWVLGSNGMLGSEICKELEKRKISYHPTTSKNADITSLSSLNHTHLKYTFTHVINCAAYTEVDQAEVEEEKAFKVNALGPEMLAEICFKNSLKLIHFSTDYVFSGKKQKPYLESDASDPINVYGKTKREGEIRVLKKNPNALILRVSWLFGIFGESFVSKILKLMQKEKKLFIVSDQIGRPTFCKDIANTLFDLLTFSGIYHWANLGALSWFDFAKSIHEKAVKKNIELKTKEIIPVKSSYYKPQAKRPEYSVLETKKVERALGKKTRSWENALDEYFLEMFN